MSKVPNLRQAPTGPTIYKPMVLPPMTILPRAPSRDPSLPSRTPSAPTIPSRAPMGPLGTPTNTVNQVRK